MNPQRKGKKGRGKDRKILFLGALQDPWVGSSRVMPDPRVVQETVLSTIQLAQRFNWVLYVQVYI